METILDYNSGSHISGKFNEVSEHQGASLGYFVIADQEYELDGNAIAVVLFGEGDYFTPIDWQGTQPNMSNHDEIEAAPWVYVDGRDAVVMNGLPRIFEL